MAERLRTYWYFLRPFTLLVPATGMLAGALMALGVDPRFSSSWTANRLDLVLQVLAGAVSAAALNAYSNGINQIFDIEVDRINKPWRLLPGGRITAGEAWIVSLTLLAGAFSLALWISHQTAMMVGAAAVLTYIYSAPPLRTKQRGFAANITIAIPRGTLLIVAGWSTVKDIREPEPWIVGAIFGCYMLGAVSTKDFSDIAGDRDCGCRTLPVVYGVRKASKLISPFIALPFLALIPAALQGVLKANANILIGLGVLLPAWGAYIAYLLLTASPEQFEHLNREGSGNHPSWKHMYCMVMVAQFGLAAAYLAP